MKNPKQIFISVALVCACIVVPARAGLIIYDGFNYTAGTDMNTDNGGTGWSAAWVPTGTGTVHTNSAPGLTYADLVVTGGAVYVQGRNNGAGNLAAPRTFNNVSITSGDIWFSFLTKPTVVLGSRFFDIALYSGGTANANQVLLVQANGPGNTTAPNNWMLQNLGNNSGTSIPVAFNAVTFVVVQITSGGTVGNLWINPSQSAIDSGSLTTADPSFAGTMNLGATTPTTVDRAFITAGGGSSTSYAGGYVDEMRLGNSFADVAPNSSGGGAGIPVIWTGNINSSWDTNTFNWLNGGNGINYMDGDSATFNDAGASSAVNLTSAFFPSSVTVSNSALTYTFSGSGSLSGSGALIKAGSGTLILDNSGANTYAGATVISNGTLQVGLNDANGSLGSGNITNYGNLVFNRTNNVLINNSITGSGNLVQSGSGTLTLGGAANHSGNTIVNAGTLVAGNLPGGGILTNAAGSTIVMTGSNAGPVFINGGLMPGNAGAAGTVTAVGNLTLGAGATLTFDIGSTNIVGSGSNDLLQVGGNLAEAGTVKVVPTLGRPLLGVPYTLAVFGSRSGNFNATVSSHYSSTFNQTATNLTVTLSGSGASLKWDAASSTAWDAGVTTNWLNGATLDYFYQGDSVTFDDTAAQPLVFLAGPMSANTVTVNSSVNNYVFGGAGRITGSASIVKSGSSLLVISNANDFTGPVTIQAGTLQVANNTALGTTNAGTTINSGAALDVNGRNLGQEPVTVTGSGMDGGAANGAIFNSGPAASPALAQVTLGGDTIVGGNGRWDLRSANANDAGGASLGTGGNPYKLTKTGVNQVGLVGVTVDPMLGDVTVQNGVLSIESATTGLGNSASNLTVGTGATLQFFQMTNRLNKKITLQNSSTLISQSGANLVIGPMTVNGAVTVTVTNNSALTLSNTLTGSGSITKNGTNTLVLAGPGAADNHTGGTTVDDGTLILNTVNPNIGSPLVLNSSASFSTVPVVVGGNGTNAGTMTVNDTIHPGAGGKPGTIGSGNLTIGFAGKAIFDLTSSTTAGNGVNDLLNVAGDFDASFTAPVVINPLATLSTNAPYTLVKYTGNLNGFFGSVGSLGRYSFALNYPPNLVTLTVAGGPVLLKWNNNSSDGLWNVQGSANWFNTATSGNDVFYNLDMVLLDDSAPSTTVTLPAGTAVSPAVITNNSTVNYTITGAGKISGPGSLVKTGSSTLIITSTNDFTGGITVNAGTVQAAGGGGRTALGGGSPTVKAGGTLAGMGQDAFGFAPNVAPTNINISGGTVTDLGTASYRITLPNLTFTGGTLASAAGNAGDANGQYALFGTSATSGCAVNTLAASSTAVINAGMISFHTEPVIFNTAAGSVSGGATPGVDLLVSSKLINFSTDTQRSVIKTGNGVLALATNNTFGGPVTITAGTIQLGTANDPVPLTTPLGTGPITNNATINVASSQAVTIANIINGTGTVTVSSGTANLNGANTYSGNTVVNGGTLAVNGVSGTGLVSVNNSGTLSGTGTLAGATTVSAGATIAPGTGGIGRLTALGNVTLHGTATMELNKTSQTNDSLAVTGNLVYGGTLNLVNLSGTLTVTDSFKLFTGATFSGAFSQIVPAIPGANLVWNTNRLTIDGTLQVASGVQSPSRVTGIHITGTTLTITATNGAPSGQYVLLQTTNLARPFSQWTPVLTNVFDGSGNLNLATNVVNPGNRQVYYILSQ